MIELYYSYLHIPLFSYDDGSLLGGRISMLFLTQQLLKTCLEVEQGGERKNTVFSFSFKTVVL